MALTGRCRLLLVHFPITLVGEYEIACSEFCGHGHGQMKAALLSISATRTNQ